MRTVSSTRTISGVAITGQSTILTIDQEHDLHLMHQQLAAGVTDITCRVKPGVQIKAHMHGAHTWPVSLHMTWIVEQNAHVAIDFFLHHTIESFVCTIELVQPGAECRISAHAGVAPQTTVEIKTAQRHHARATQSRVLVKTLVGAQAHSMYHGTITILKDAHGSRAQQLNKNCLLSDLSHARSFPALEALTDDVSCSHGSATGPINSEHLWFLTTRGYSQEQARATLLRAFLSQGLQDGTTCVHATNTVSTQCIEHSLDRLIAHSQGAT